MLVDAPTEFRKQAASRGGKVAFLTAAAFEGPFYGGFDGFLSSRRTYETIR